MEDDGQDAKPLACSGLVEVSSCQLRIIPHVLCPRVPQRTSKKMDLQLMGKTAMQDLCYSRRKAGTNITKCGSTRRIVNVLSIPMLEESGYKASTHTDNKWKVIIPQGEVIVFKQNVGVCNRMP